jgi:hypothetical protein
MNRLLYLVPVLALVGCDQGSNTTPAKPVRNAPAATRTGPIVGEPARAPVAGDPPPKADAKDPPGRPAEVEEPKEDPPEAAPPVPETYKPLNKGKTIFFEKAPDGGRRVHLMAEVCLREGPLEVFLCKLNTKEHESILHIDADAREIHFALVAAGAEPGSPVKFVPDFKAATGTKVKVSVTYREKGKVKTAPANEWIKDKRTDKPLAHDWVFAGSRFFKDPERPKAPDYYMANNGEVISLSNFPDSMMDLPVKSPKEAADLIFEVDTPKVPPLRTPVLVSLEPVVEKK